MPGYKDNFLNTFKTYAKEILAEFIGTLFLVLVGCGSTVAGEFNERVTFLEIALCFGLSVGVIVHIMSHISGGHINPAVTLGMVFAMKIPIVKAIFYIISQLLGAIVGAALLFAALPSNQNHFLGVTKVHPSLSVAQAFEIELFITFLLVFAVFMTFDPSKTDARQEPMIIGFVVAACHIFAIKFTGASMNTARSFGPALVRMEWDDHWVYWVGPLAGGIIAGLLYKLVFETPQYLEVKMAPERPVQSREDVEKAMPPNIMQDND